MGNINLVDIKDQPYVDHIFEKCPNVLRKFLCMGIFPIKLPDFTLIFIDYFLIPASNEFISLLIAQTGK